MAGGVYFCTCSFNSFPGGGGEFRGVTPGLFMALEAAAHQRGPQMPVSGPHPDTPCGDLHTSSTMRACSRLITSRGPLIPPRDRSFEEQPLLGGADRVSSGLTGRWQGVGWRGGRLVLVDHNYGFILFL